VSHIAQLCSIDDQIDTIRRFEHPGGAHSSGMCQCR